ncbi:MAG: hypothetical protein GY820_46400 [Gammaproteobacteria bacterium]|nr:hypothetical protein [Gammaproteobacteria bacterium]
MHECLESDGEREKFIFRWSLLSKSGSCRRSKRGHGCASRCQKLVRSELVSEIGWCRQPKVTSTVFLANTRGNYQFSGYRCSQSTLLTLLRAISILWSKTALWAIPILRRESALEKQLLVRKIEIG